MKRQKRLEQQLERLYTRVPAPPQGLAPGRERMLAEARRLRVQHGPNARTERRHRMRFALAYKLVAAVLAVIVVTALTGGGVALAAGNSLPDQTLYPVKLAIEDARLQWAARPAAQAELNLAFAAERVQEMERLAAAGEQMPADALQRMARHTEQAMAYMASAQPDQVAPLMAQAMARTEEQLQVMAHLEGEARSGEGQIAWRHAYQTAEQAQQMLVAAQGDPVRFQQEYRHRHGGTTPPQGPGQKPGTPAATPQRRQEKEGAEITPEQDRRREQSGPQGPSGGTPTTPTPQQHKEQKGPQATPTPQQHKEQNGPQATPTPQQHKEQNGPQATPTPQQHKEQNGPQATPTASSKGKQ